MTAIPFLRSGFPFRTFFTVRKVLFILIPFLATVAVIWKFFLVVDVPFRLDYAEGFVFTNTLSVVHGIPIYHSVETTPYMFGFYTPLYNYVSAFFVQLFEPSIAVLRTLSFLFYLATSVAIGYIVQRTTKNLFAAVFSALFFTSAFIVSQWSSIARPDMLGMLFIVLGIAASFARNHRSTTRMVIVALLLSLAFFSKQSFVFAALAFFLSFVFEKRKEAWIFAGAYAFFVGAGVLTLHLLTQGEFTKQIFVYAGLVPYGNFSTAFRITVITGIAALPFILFAIVKVLQYPKNFFSLYFLCSLLTFCMLLRDGGIQNYLMEFVLALVLLVSTSFPWEKVQTVTAKVMYPSLLILQVFFGLWAFTAFPWETKAYITERLNLFQSETKKIELGSRILVEDPLVAYAIDAAVEIDPYTYGQVADAGRIATTDFFAAIENGTYAHIVDYGAFRRIAGLLPIVEKTFPGVFPLALVKPVKPFDYSLYNRNTVTVIGTLYTYSAREKQRAE